jgi:hypothetical protein
MDVDQKSLLQYEYEGDKFLCNTVTGDESWVHHLEPENKRQSVEYHHKGSPAPKKFKTIPSADNIILLTAFWDVNGVMHSGFMPTGTTINSKHNTGKLQKLKACIRRVHPNM